MRYPRWLALAALALQLSIVAPVWAQGEVSFSRQDFRGKCRQVAGVTRTDFNRDGRQDVAIVSTFGGDVSIFLGRGDGTFEVGPNFPVSGGAPATVTVADFNGDGLQDLATGNHGAFGRGTVSIMLGRGDGTFTMRDFALGNVSPSSGITAGDFNGDGQQDVATAASGGSTVSVMLGNGDGTLQPPQHIQVTCCPQSIKVGDFNDDGQQDLATANSSGSPDVVSILLGNGDGTFAGGLDTDLGADLNPTSITVGDFNGDSQQDVATATLLHAGTGVASVLLGQGDGTFGPVRDFAVGGFTGSITVADFNGDGRQDLATSNFTASTVSILLGQGDGTFEPAQDFGSGEGPQEIITGDFNGDGREDIVTANAFSLSILINTGPVELTTYRLTRIGDVSFNPDLRDINQNGEMVGASSFELERAILLRDGVVTELGDLAGGAAQSAVAVGINDVAQVVGSNKIQDASGNLVDRGFLWEGGQIRDLGVPGATPRDINNEGRIVGNTLGTDNVIRPFLWLAGNTFLLETLDELECPPGPVLRSDAVGINSNGLMVGFSQSPNGPRAVFWRSFDHQVMSLEPPVPLAAGEARDVNDQGEVIGRYRDESGFVTRSFLWRASGAVSELLPLERAGQGADALVSSINNRGQIVGNTRTETLSQPDGTFATLWQHGAVRELNELISDDDPLKGEVNLFNAIEINDAGVILARGLEAGLGFTYVLTPTGNPAPASAASPPSAPSPPPSASSPPASDNNGGGAVDLVSLLLLVIVMSAGATCARRRRWRPLRSACRLKE